MKINEVKSTQFKIISHNYELHVCVHKDTNQLLKEVFVRIVNETSKLVKNPRDFIKIFFTKFPNTPLSTAMIPARSVNA